MPRFVSTLSLSILLAVASGVARSSTIVGAETLAGQAETTLVILGSTVVLPAAEAAAGFPSGVAATPADHTVPLEVPLPGSGLLYLAALFGLVGWRIRPGDYWRTPRPS